MPEPVDGCTAKIPRLCEDDGEFQTMSSTGWRGLLGTPGTCQTVVPSVFRTAGGSTTPETSFKSEDLIWRSGIGHESPGYRFRRPRARLGAGNVQSLTGEALHSYRFLGTYHPGECRAPIRTEGPADARPPLGRSDAA
jgi:hypothetical protein